MNEKCAAVMPGVGMMGGVIEEVEKQQQELNSIIRTISAKLFGASDKLQGTTQVNPEGYRGRIIAIAEQNEETLEMVREINNQL